MDYKRIYNNIITKAQTRDVPTVYTEKHHIIPRSLGGSNDPSNIVVLTGREHYLAHYCLAKFCQGDAKGKMLHAFTMMNYINPTGEKKRYINSRLYQSLRQEYAQSVSQEKTGTKHSEVTKKKISLAHLGKTFSDESRLLMSVNNTMHTTVSVLKNAIAQIENALFRTKGFQKQHNRYQASAKINNKRVHVGHFKTAKEAFRAAFGVRRKHLKQLKHQLDVIQSF